MNWSLRWKPSTSKNKHENKLQVENFKVQVGWPRAMRRRLFNFQLSTFNFQLSTEQMRRFSQHSHLVTLSEINITPLLDLAFVLLIIFVITTPLLEQSINLKLPTGGQPDQPLDKHDIRTVEISPQGTYAMNKLAMKLNRLVEALAGGGNPTEPPPAPQPQPPAPKPQPQPPVSQPQPPPRVQPTEPPKPDARERDSFDDKSAKKLPNVSLKQVTRPTNKTT